MSADEKRQLIEPENKQISLSRQCQILGLARATWYYQSKAETDQNLQLMKLIDAQYTQTPFYGVRRMTAWLQTQGYQVNHFPSGSFNEATRLGNDLSTS